MCTARACGVAAKISQWDLPAVEQTTSPGCRPDRPATACRPQRVPAMTTGDGVTPGSKSVREPRGQPAFPELSSDRREGWLGPLQRAATVSHARPGVPPIVAYRTRRLEPSLPAAGQRRAPPARGGRWAWVPCSPRADPTPAGRLLCCTYVVTHLPCLSRVRREAGPAAGGRVAAGGWRRRAPCCQSHPGRRPPLRWAATPPPWRPSWLLVPASG